MGCEVEIYATSNLVHCGYSDLSQYVTIVQGYIASPAAVDSSSVDCTSCHQCTNP